MSLSPLWSLIGGPEEEGLLLSVVVYVTSNERRVKIVTYWQFLRALAPLPHLQRWLEDASNRKSSWRRQPSVINRVQSSHSQSSRARELFLAPPTATVDFRFSFWTRLCEHRFYIIAGADPGGGVKWVASHPPRNIMVNIHSINQEKKLILKTTVNQCTFFFLFIGNLLQDSNKVVFSEPFLFAMWHVTWPKMGVPSGGRGHHLTTLPQPPPFKKSWISPW